MAKICLPRILWCLPHKGPDTFIYHLEHPSLRVPGQNQADPRRQETWPGGLHDSSSGNAVQGLVRLITIASRTEPTTPVLPSFLAGRTDVSWTSEVHLGWQPLIMLRQGEQGPLPEVCQYRSTCRPSFGLRVRCCFRHSSR